MTIISILNQKGGVTKTTSTVTLGHGTARAGLKTLIIDLDPQANCSDALGVAVDAAAPTPNLYSLLVEKATLAEVALEVRENLYLVRSDHFTVEVKSILMGKNFREYALANVLKRHPFDVVFIDNAPSLDVLQTAALVASDYVIIPSTMKQLSVKGIYETQAILSTILSETPSQCQIAAIVPTIYDRRAEEQHKQLVNLVDVFGALVWPVVPVFERATTANRKGLTLWEYAPRCTALIGYKDDSGQRVGGYEEILARVLGLL